MPYYAYSIAGAATEMTGNANQPPNRTGTIRFMTVNNPNSSAITLKFIDSNDGSVLTTAVAGYNTWDYVSADAYGFYEYGTTPRNAVGTPFFSAATTFTPPDAAPTGTGLPSDVPAESQDYESALGVFWLDKYSGVKTEETAVAPNATTPLVPFFIVIIPANSVWYSTGDGPWLYVSGIVAVSSSSDAVSLTAIID